MRESPCCWPLIVCCLANIRNDWLYDWMLSTTIYRNESSTSKLTCEDGTAHSTCSIKSYSKSYGDTGVMISTFLTCSQHSIVGKQSVSISETLKARDHLATRGSSLVGSPEPVGESQQRSNALGIECHWKTYLNSNIIVTMITRPQALLIRQHRPKKTDMAQEP